MALLLLLSKSLKRISSNRWNVICKITEQKRMRIEALRFASSQFSMTTHTHAHKGSDGLARRSRISMKWHLMFVNGWLCESLIFPRCRDKMEFDANPIKYTFVTPFAINIKITYKNLMSAMLKVNEYPNSGSKE